MFLLFSYISFFYFFCLSIGARPIGLPKGLTPLGPLDVEMMWYWRRLVESSVDDTTVVFTDTDKLRGRQFGYGLGPDPGSELAQFTESVSLSLYVDVKGVVQAGSRIVLHEPTDPIDSVKVPDFGRNNRFVQGLERVLDTVPDGTIILFPTRRIDRQGVEVMYPDHTPPGYVPCVGQTLKYRDGSEIYVPSIPVPTDTIDIPLYNARYMMKVPVGWKTPDPALPNGLDSRELDSIIPPLFNLI